MRAPLVLVLWLLSAVPATAAGDRPAQDVRPRVEHHLREAEHLAQQLETVVASECPRFATRGEWEAYLDGSVDRVVSLVAHLEQAWVEAKQTGDKDVRREAKAPRRRIQRAQLLLAKLHTCADGHGASLSPESVWQRVERDVPGRQAEIALPPDRPQ